ncbi:MAG: class I SAM-dependent methyltransferase [Candidatus Bipolaricaulota bacterium]|nr:class I SAM-dependent methyltransferase [Candidatus Bipolaricaulota bacterium]
MMDSKTEGDEKVYEKLESLIKHGFRILDVGCGDGSFLNQITKHHDISGVGIDPSPAKREDADTNCTILKAESVGELEEKFDLVYSINSLHHFGDVSEFFEGVPEKLKRPGNIILADWKEGASTGRPESYFSREHISKLMTEAGFEVTESRDLERQFFLVGKLF